MTDATSGYPPGGKPRSKADSGITGGGATAPRSALSRFAWPKLLAISLVLLYLAGAGVGWLSNGSDGYYGLTTVDTPPDQPNRLRIVQIAPGSPADRAGLRAGDVVLAIDGERLGKNLRPGSRGRSAPAGVRPSFQTRPLAVPPGDMPVFRRTTGYREPGVRSTIQVERQKTGESGTTGPATLDMSVVLGSRLDAPGTMLNLLTWHLVALLTLAVSLFVFLRRPSDITSRLLLGMAAGFAAALVLLSWDNRPLPDIVAFFLIQATVFLLIAGSAALLHLCLIFPSHHPVFATLASLGRVARTPLTWVAVALYILPLAVGLGLFLGPAVIWPWSYAVVSLLIGLALLALARSMLKPPGPTARAQLKWVAGPLAVGLVALALGPLVRAATGGRFEVLPATVTVAAWALFPLGLGVAILRYRLFDVDIVFRAAILYPLLAALLAGSYVAAALLLGLIAATLLGPGVAKNITTPVLAALLVAASAQPIYRRLQAGLDSLFYKERLARQRLLAEAGALLGQTSPEDLVTFLTGHVVNRLDLARVWLVLPTGVTASDGLVPSALAQPAESLLARMRDIARPVFLLDEEFAAGGLNALYASDPALGRWYGAGGRLLLPLLASTAPEPGVAAALLGVWVIGHRRSGSSPDSEDLKLLSQIARQAAVLLDYDRLHWREAAEIQRTARFRRYFSPQVADLIAGEGGDLASHRRELTVLFAELRGLSPHDQNVEPEELVGNLNDCLAIMTEAVFAHGGTLDKYLGNGVMAFFGDPLPQTDHAARATRAALAMQNAFAKPGHGHEAPAARSALGIGLATGWVTAGTIGSAVRQDYTVVGDAVGIATRLAAVAGPGEVLLTEKTRRLLGEDVPVVPRGEVTVEGWQQPVPVYGLTVGRAATTLLGSARHARVSAIELARDMDTDPELLAQTALFASLPSQELQRLASHMRLQRFKRGTAILRAHEACHSFFLIRSGTVKVTRTLVTGDEAVINILGRGEFFGELALLEGRSGGSTVVALQPTEVLVLSHEVFLNSLQAYPSAASAAIAFLSERVRYLSEQLEDAYSLELPQRLARRLLALGNTHGKRTEEGVVIDISLTQSDLAAMVGASRQRVNRVLAEWQDRHLLELGSYGRLTLLRPETLADLSP